MLLLIIALHVHGEERTVPEKIPVRKDRMYEDVLFLTTIEPARNYRNVASLNKAADYIIAEFRKTGCRISTHTFSGGGNEYRNITCSFGPVEGERIIVGAHYDVYGDQPGADDNASGIAGMIEVGRLIAEVKPAIRYRTDLVAFTLEEPRPFGPRHMGSKEYAKMLSDSGVRVRTMISLEMIGYFTDRPDSQQYPIFFLKWMYPKTGNYIAVVGKWGQGDLVRNVKRLMKASSAIPVESIAAPRYLPGIDFSDHESFWKYNYPAVMITDTAFYRNKNYHRATDTIDTLDFHRMAEVVKGIYWVTLNL